jgi:hypothetical protein
MLPFGVTIPATVPQGSEIPEGLMNNPVSIIEIVRHIKRRNESVEHNLDVHKYIMQNKIGFAC